MKKPAVCFLVILGLAGAALVHAATQVVPVAPTPPPPGVVQLAWNASASDTNAADPYNYIVEQNTVSNGAFSVAYNCGTNLSLILSNLTGSAQFFWVVVAEDTNTGLVSPYSNYTNWTAPFQPGAPVIKARTILAQ